MTTYEKAHATKNRQLPLSSPPPLSTAVNAPPAGATLVLLGSSATLDRAADSPSRVRVTLIGAPPAVASVPIGAADGGRTNPPQLQAAAAALAALPPKAPVVLVGTGPDGAHKCVVLSLAETPPQVLAADAASPARVALDGDVVAGPQDVTLAKGAAAAYVSGPGRLTRSTVPARATFGGGAAVYIDTRW